MEKSSPRSESPRKLKTNLLCIPSLKHKVSSENYHHHRNNNNNRNHKSNNKVLSPITLLDRFREAVFRLIMLSAISSGHGHGDSGHNISTAMKKRRSINNNYNDYYYNYNYHHFESNDHRNSESVADCIEFIKKKAEVGHDEIDHRYFNATTSSSDADSTANRFTTTTT